MDYSKRIQKIQRFLRRKKIDALLVSEPYNRRYLSGYTPGDHGIGESAGVLLITARKKTYLLTDFRFQIQAEQEVHDASIRLYTKGLLALLTEMLPDLGIRSLGFESGYTLHSFSEKLAAMADKKGIQLVPLTSTVEKHRLVKEEEEIAKIRTSVALNEKVFQQAYSSIAAGMTETELALHIEQTMRLQGAEELSFPTIVATGARSALPHAVPGNVAILDNQPLMIDMGLVLDGYCSDMTRTFVPKAADDHYLKIHRLVRKAQLAGMKAVRAGVTAREVDQAARRVIADAGYGKYFGHSLGHGVGMAVHENPRVSSLNRKKLRAGMVITIEPGIYLPDWGGVRLENMVIVREDGCENLNTDTTWLDI